MGDPEPTARTTSPVAALGLLFVVALVLRVSGVVSNAPTADEGTGASVRVLVGELTPSPFIYPPLLYYLNAAGFAIMFAAGRLLGVWLSPGDFQVQYFHDPTPFLAATRVVTATLGALAAPLAVLLAERLRLGRWPSLFVGVLVALMPLHVYLSHFAKSDIGAVGALLFLAWAIVQKLDKPDAQWADAVVGFGAVLAPSFKQTTVLVVVPAALGLIMLLRWQRGVPWRQIGRSAGVALATGLLAAIPMNIGVLLDPRSFLDHQRLAALQSMRKATVGEIARALMPVLAGTFTGMSIPALAAWLVAPLVRRDRPFLLLWVATAVGVLVLGKMAGHKPVANHFMPAEVLAVTLAGVAVGTLWERGGAQRVVGAALGVALLVNMAYGAAVVNRQALARPMGSRVDEVIQSVARPGGDRILSGGIPGSRLPVDASARHDDRERHERLARKYGVTLPPQAPEHAADTTRGYYIRNFPYAYGGLETLKPEEVTVHRPFVWPIQPEEFELDYWTGKGFSVFVVQNEAGFLNCDVPAYRSFHRQIRERCDLVAVISSTRPLFDGSNVQVYKVRTASPAGVVAGRPVAIPGPSGGAGPL